MVPVKIFPVSQTARAAPPRTRKRVDRRSRDAALLFLSSIQYFLVQYLVALDWPHPYSLTMNTISDLGNTTCATFHQRHVCSPLHAVMNVSLFVLGFTMVVGALLLRHDLDHSRTRSVGLLLLLFAGAGVSTVGFFPENTVATVHAVGASLPFLLGNAGLVALGVSLDATRAFRALTVSVGVVTLVALLLYSRGQYFDLGEGGMERVVAYPQTIWLIFYGGYLWRRSTRAAPTRRHDRACT